MSLFEIVEVDPNEKIRCQAPGCHKSVYKRIHVVIDGDRVLAVGSDCWLRLYSDAAGTDAKPRHGGSHGRVLTAEERAQLDRNTAEFVARKEQEVARAAANEQAGRARLEEGRPLVKQRERERWQVPALDPADPPYIFSERDMDFRRANRTASNVYRDEEGDQSTRDLLAKKPAFRRFPARWIARAMVRVQEDFISPGTRVDDPGVRERIEAAALQLLERYYRP